MTLYPEQINASILSKGELSLFGENIRSSSHDYAARSTTLAGAEQGS